MRRTETVCPRCRQVNIRHHGFGAWLVNPRYPRQCTLCGTDLRTGERSPYLAVLGGVGWAATYVGHLVAGIGIAAAGAALIWPGILNQPVLIRVAPLAAGAATGVALAEWSRRRGELLGRSKNTEKREESGVSYPRGPS